MGVTLSVSAADRDDPRVWGTLGDHHHSILICRLVNQISLPTLTWLR